MSKPSSTPNPAAGTQAANSEALPHGKPYPQVFGRHQVQTCRRKSTGERFARVFSPRGGTSFIPRDICGLAAGKDAWMRQISFPCDGDCGNRATAGEMQNGFCPDCTREQEEENARMDEAGESDYGNRMEAELARREMTEADAATLGVTTGPLDEDAKRLFRGVIAGWPKSERVENVMLETVAFLRA